MFYLPQYAPLPRLKANEKSVLHQQVCPVCGEKNINLYWYSEQWQCRRCCEMEKKLDGGSK